MCFKKKRLPPTDRRATDTKTRVHTLIYTQFYNKERSSYERAKTALYSTAQVGSQGVGAHAHTRLLELIQRFDIRRRLRMLDSEYISE